MQHFIFHVKKINILRGGNLAMVNDKYAWQTRTFSLWANTGFKGVLFAVPSAG